MLSTTKKMNSTNSTKTTSKVLIDEIITNPPRDEYLSNYVGVFTRAPVVAKIKDLVVKKDEQSDDIKYGLFDKQGRLVGYFSLHLYKDMWMVDLVQIAQAYKGLGYGTFLYDYAVMNDKLKVLSDATNTGGPDGSRTLWVSLFNKKRYRIVGYDTTTDQVIPNATPNDIYNEKSNCRWLALPPGETINEAINRIQNCMPADRYVVWYGPGTTDENYFNY